MNNRTNKFGTCAFYLVAILSQASAVRAEDSRGKQPAIAATYVANGLETLAKNYDEPARAAEYASPLHKHVIVACGFSAYEAWESAYLSILQNTALQTEGIVSKLNRYAKIKSEIESHKAELEARYPGIFSVVKNEIRMRRQKGSWPVSAESSSMTLNNLYQADFQDEVAECKLNKDFLKSAAAKLPRKADKKAARKALLQTADRKYKWEVTRAGGVRFVLAPEAEYGNGGRIDVGVAAALHSGFQSTSNGRWLTFRLGEILGDEFAEGVDQDL